MERGGYVLEEYHDLFGKTFEGKTSFVVDRDGSIYLISGHAILKIDKTTSQIYVGDVNDPDDVIGDRLAARFFDPTSLVLDSCAHILYIADTGNNKIKKLTLNDGNVSVLAGSECGRVDAKGTKAQFDEPLNIVLDSDGNLLVFDFQNSCIRRVQPDGRVSTVAYHTGKASDKLAVDPISSTFYICGEAHLRKFSTGNTMHTSLVASCQHWDDKYLQVAFGLVPPRLVVLLQHPLSRSTWYSGQGRRFEFLDSESKLVPLNVMVRSKPELEAILSSVSMKQQHTTTDFWGNIYIMTGKGIMCLHSRLPWSTQRLLWIAHLKEEPEECKLAVLPKDILREIITFLWGNFGEAL